MSADRPTVRTLDERLDALEAKVKALIDAHVERADLTRYEQCVAFGRLLVERAFTTVTAPIYAIAVLLFVLRFTGFTAADVNLLWNPLASSEAPPAPAEGFDLPPVSMPAEPALEP